MSALLLSAMPTAAQPSASYRELVRKALVAFDAKHWDQARSLFQTAHQLEPNARTLRGLGMVAFEMEDFVTAYQLLHQSLLDPRRALEGSLREQTQALLKRTRLLVGRLRLEVTPPGATVKLDSEPIDASEELWLNIGLHLLTIEAEGYDTKKLSLDVRNGDDQELSIDLDPLALAAAPRASDLDSPATRVTASLGVNTRTPPRDNGTILNKWWFWAAAGGFVAVGVGAVILASGGQRADKAPTEGTGGVVITALSLP